MIKLFRNIRQKLLKEGKTANYFKYAIGEIVLVVIGILIALQINNWNEQRLQKNELINILITVKNDLKNDTLTLSTTLKNYQKKNNTIKTLLNNEIPKSYFDTINESNYEQCKFCKNQIIEYHHIFIQNKGIELLKKIASSSTDTLVSSLLNFHNVYKEYFDDDNNIIKGLGRENGALLEKYDWYIDLRTNKYNDQYISYISDSNEYRNKMATYRVFSITAANDIHDYKKKATNYLKILEEMFQEN